MINSLGGLKKWDITLHGKGGVVSWQTCFANTKDEVVASFSMKNNTQDWKIDKVERNRNITAEDVVRYLKQRKQEIELCNMANITEDEDISTLCLDIILSEIE